MVSLFSYLEKGKFKYQRNFNLKDISSIKIGPKTDVFIEPENIGALADILTYLEGGAYNYRVIGALTNTLFASRHYTGVIVSTSRMRSIWQRGKEIFAECGVRLSALMSYAERLGLGGFPGLCHIPGCIGAAVRGNVGAFGNEISDIFVEGSFLNKKGEIINLSHSDMNFGYRTSMLKGEALTLLSAGFMLSELPTFSIQAAREECLRLRKNTQPLGERSLGSVFMRHNGVSAGYYIDKAGLKGYRIGDAAVSTKHAGFIVNLGNAVADDVLLLIEYIKKVVFEEFDVRLKEEIEIIS